MKTTRRAILHLGMHKTGTTSIQRALRDYDDGRIAVSGLSAPSHDAALVSLFGRGPLNALAALQVVFRPENLPIERARLSGLLQHDLDRTDRDIIYSAEALSLPCFSGDLAEGLLPRLRSAFDRIEAFASVRTPGAFMAAWLYQRVGAQIAIADWQDVWPSYRARFEVWDQSVDRLIWQLYDPAQFPEGDAVLAFQEALGLHLTPPEAAMNVSGGLYHTAAHYAQALLGRDLISNPEDAAGRQRLRAVIATLPVRKFRIAPQSLAALIEENSPDINWIAARLPEFDLRSELRANPDIYELEAPAHLLEVAADMRDRVQELAPAFTPKSRDRAQQVAEILDHLLTNCPARDHTSRISHHGRPDISVVADALEFDFYSRQAGEAFPDKASAARHYLRDGWRLGLDPAPWFSTRHYLQDNPDVAQADFPPLLHFIRHGATEGRHARPSSLG